MHQRFCAFDALYVPGSTTQMDLTTNHDDKCSKQPQCVTPCSPAEGGHRTKTSNNNHSSSDVLYLKGSVNHGGACEAEREQCIIKLFRPHPPSPSLTSPRAGHEFTRGKIIVCSPVTLQHHHNRRCGYPIPAALAENPRRSHTLTDRRLRCFIRAWQHYSDGSDNESGC